jgi:hypothetical protein
MMGLGERLLDLGETQNLSATKVEQFAFRS